MEEEEVKYTIKEIFYKLYYIYELIDQNGVVLYYGYTNNPKRRLHEHNKEFKAQKKGLYKRMAKRGVTEIKMNVLEEEVSKYRAKLKETRYIVNAKLDMNSQILNQLI
jgi:predicted GIY-YIG superfamily endonuclease